MTSRRISCREEEITSAVIPVLREQGLPPHDFLDRLSHRIRALGATDTGGRRLVRDYVWTSGDSVKFSNIAGTVSLGKHNLEIAPKFLDPDGAWHSDWVAILSATRQGHLDFSERVSADFDQHTDLATITAAAMVDEHVRRARRPLRRPRRHVWRSWQVDGDIDIVDALVPDADGLLQTETRRSTRNQHAALLAAAYDRLLPQVRNAEIRARTAKMRQSLGVQSRPRPLAERAPIRMQEWQPLLSMAKKVVEGSSITPRLGSVVAPSFLVRTWQAWEELLLASARRRPAVLRAAPHQRYDWAQRGAKPIQVDPDLTVTIDETTLLVDAKYKGRSEDESLVVSQGDLMEASAFTEAAGVDRILLLYPRSSALVHLPTGRADVADVVELPNGRWVVAAGIEVRGYGQRGGSAAFEDGLATLCRWCATSDPASWAPGMSVPAL